MADPAQTQSGWAAINATELWSTMGMSAAVGALRLGWMIRRGRDFRAIDLVLDPAMAVFAGTLSWLLTEYSNAPDLIQAVSTSLGAWAGPRLVAALEQRYLATLPGPVAPDTINPEDSKQ